MCFEMNAEVWLVLDVISIAEAQVHAPNPPLCIMAALCAVDCYSRLVAS